MAEQVIQFHPSRPRSRLASVGLFLRRNRRTIIAIQWLVVLLYAAMVIIPAFLPLPPEDAPIWDNPTLFAQFCFWGLWWPGVMIATVTMGRVWCGLFCPEGSVSEWGSPYGRGKPLPRWLKWSGWPFVAFICTTVYGQLVSVYEYPQAALLVLGGSTVAAVGIGLLYGREKRIWCRYLCPASGVFAVLAKIAPLHYKVDRAAWDRYEGEFQPVNCAPLVDVRRMTSAGECHSCGRCAGQRDAVALSWRSPFSEVLDFNNPAKTPDVLTLVYGVLGVATAAFQWTVGPAIASLLLKTEHLSWQRFALALAPLAGASVILGLSMLTVTHLKAEHLWLGWLPVFRIALLSLGSAGTLWLALQLVRRSTSGILAKLLAFLAMLLPPSLMVTLWSLVFFVW